MRKTIFILSLLAFTGLSQMSVKAQIDTLVSMKSENRSVSIRLEWTPVTAIVNVNGVNIKSGIWDTILVNANGTVFVTAENNVQLKWLHCYYNRLTELDVSKNTALMNLSCYDNLLSKLDVSKNTALTDLYCYNNLLTKLDVSNNTALRNLYCYYNQIAELDVSKNTALIYLWCHSNNLSELDVSKNTALTMMNCGKNQLTRLDVSKNTAFTLLYASEQQIEIPILAGTTTFFNPIYYKTVAGNNNVRIEGTWYAYQDEVAITKDTMAFTVSATVGPNFGGNMVFVLSYTVTFESNGGSAVAEQMAKANSQAAEPVTPTKEGFIFGGWFADADLSIAWDFATSIITQDTTLYAKWVSSVTTHPVTFYSNGGTPVPQQQVIEGNTVSPVTTTRPGYTLEGWYRDDITFTQKWTIATDLVYNALTLYAKWKEGGTSIAETQASTINIYPNPAQHIVYIESAEEVEQVRVYDVSGRELMQIANPAQSIDISRLANGVYLVKVKTAQGETVRKISRLAN